MAASLPSFTGAAELTTSAVTSTYRQLQRSSRVKAALAQIQKEDPRTLQEQIQIAEIPAPPFKEATRAADYVRRLREAGLDDVTVDAEGNVIGRRPGVGAGPTLVLSAHLDTVFPEGSDVKVRKEGGRYYGRGLGDDSRGLAVLLTVLRALQENRLQTTGTLLFVGTVGEEGLGNLRGVKALFHANTRVDGFISVDSIDTPEQSRSGGSIIGDATGSRRWALIFSGPGGHSYENFGVPSATHALGRAIAAIADVRPPAEPKTTFTVGIVSGGTAVNAIAAEAQMQVDIRSVSADVLSDLERNILELADQAARAENARWNSSVIRVERKLLGDRPAGSQPRDTPVIMAALGAAAALGLPEPKVEAASTDASVPIGLGVPAATVSGGGQGGDPHSPGEWYEPVRAWLGPQAVLLTSVALVGLDGVSKPLLPRRRDDT